MRLDSADNHSVAGGKTYSGQTVRTVPEEKNCPGSNDWCYMFVHHSKVEALSEKIATRFRVFVHKTVTFVKKDSKVVRQERPTISGLIFIQGNPDIIKDYLREECPHHYLSNNKSLGKTAVIRDSEMQLFMQTMQVDPTRIRFMEKPYEHYGKFYPQVQVTSGPFAGKEGFIIRIHRNRHFVMQFGHMAIAISGIHKETFINSPQSQLASARLENSEELISILEE